MTDARMVRPADLLLLGAAAAGQLADRYRPHRRWRARRASRYQPRGGWWAVRTDRAVAPDAGPGGRTGGGQPVEVSRRARRLVAAGLLAVTPGYGYEPRPYQLTDAGYAILHAHGTRDLRRWWMSGDPRSGAVSFYPARTAGQALARHRAALAPGDTTSPRALDGPLTTDEMLRRAASLDSGWAAAWAVAGLRGHREVPTAPLDAAAAAQLLPAQAVNAIAATVNARGQQHRDYLATGFAPPEVPPGSRNSWHAWLGGAAASAVLADAATAPAAAPGLTPVHEGPPAAGVGAAFPPPRPARAGAAATTSPAAGGAPTARASHRRRP